MTGQPEQAIELIPISRITIANPRVRNKKSFRELADSIAELGLKRPITVTLRDESDGFHYDLVCGQGRMEAYLALGQSEIPAFVIDAEPEDRMVKSLVENCARRHHRAIDLLYDIEGMKHRGHTEADIARKTGLSSEYVRGVIGLLERGEQRLLRAVESGNMPVSVAVAIAHADDSTVQDALQQAYEQNLLRGRKLLIAKRLVENRRRRGKGLRVSVPKRTKTLSSSALVRAYKESTDRKRLLVRKADSTRNRLIFMTEAFKNLLDDENFVTLLRAEKLETLPRNLADRIQRGEAA